MPLTLGLRLLGPVKGKRCKVGKRSQKGFLRIAPAGTVSREVPHAAEQSGRNKRIGLGDLFYETQTRQHSVDGSVFMLLARVSNLGISDLWGYSTFARHTELSISKNKK